VATHSNQKVIKGYRTGRKSDMHTDLRLFSYFVIKITQIYNFEDLCRKNSSFDDRETTIDQFFEASSVFYQIFKFRKNNLDNCLIIYQDALWAENGTFCYQFKVWIQLLLFPHRKYENKTVARVFLCWNSILYKIFLLISKIRHTLNEFKRNR
jgi:hypothetical protein